MLHSPQLECCFHATHAMAMPSSGQASDPTLIIHASLKTAQMGFAGLWKLSALSQGLWSHVTAIKISLLTNTVQMFLCASALCALVAFLLSANHAQHVLYQLLLYRVINKGVVVEDGSHNQLLESGGVYATLVRRQMQKNTSSASLGSLAHTESSASLRDLVART